MMMIIRKRLNTLDYLIYVPAVLATQKLDSENVGHGDIYKRLNVYC